MEQTKLCPFRKVITYESGRNAGTGYPTEWRGTEEFCKCLGEKCAMWYHSEISGDAWCKMAR